MPVTDVDLSTYVRVGRFDLPTPSNTPAPNGSLLAQEASSVTYNWDTDTLFVVGDGGTSVVQVSKTGEFINSMTLAPGGSPQGTEFFDTEGLTYIGNGQFVMTEERDRQAVLFTYQPDTTLTRAETSTVDLGTDIGNVGLEGLTYDPQTNGFIFVKEKTPEGIFQTGIDFVNHTATNGSATTENSTNLFDPALIGTSDLSDVFALSLLPSLTGQPDSSHLLIISQEAGKVVEVDRAGNVLSTLTIVGDADNPLSVPDMTMEGVVMDRDGFLYIVNENGGPGGQGPQLWVYAPTGATNQAPTAIALTGQTNSIAENTDTTSRIKVANIQVTDDGLGTNNFSVSGADAQFFEADSTGLYIKAKTVLDFETKNSYSVTVNVDDPNVGATPDASTTFTLSVTDVVNEVPSHPNVIISEVAPWSSGNAPGLGADWFEVTNTGTSALNITGWKMDDNSDLASAAVALNGITSIAPGESVIFIETSNLDTAKTAFINLWFGSNAPAGLQIGSYNGGGVGLSTGGDHVNLFDADNNLKASVAFGASPSGPFPTFDNWAGINGTATPLTALASAGVHGAAAATNDASEIGSPGTVGRLFISEVAPWSSGDSPVGADWFEVTNSTAFDIDVTGWRMDDNSQSFALGAALNGVATIHSGESVIFIEGGDAAKAAFIDTWFGGHAPVGLQIGTYSGSGVGLSTSGDQVNLYDNNQVLRASVVFGASPSGPDFATFDNSAGLNNTTISDLSDVGLHSAAKAENDPAEIGSPGTVGRLFISEVAPWSSGDSPVGADWFEVTNTSASAIDITGWKMDDSSNSFAAAVALSGISKIGAGESVVFIEGGDAAKAAFIDTWFGGHAPVGLQIGTYSGSGVGLSTSGDAVNLFDSSGALRAGVTFGTSPSGPFATFDNEDGLTSATVSHLSVAGDNGAFVAASDATETGSPGVYTGPINDKPIFTSPASFDMAENLTAVGTVVAVDPEHDTFAFALAGGDDQNFFTIDSHTGALQFAATPDFETKADADHDNVYDLMVSATDEFGASAIQTIQVHVTDVAEAGKTLTGGNSNDALTGTTGDDTMNGANGNDALDGGDGDDAISGGNGNDALLGGRGNDALEGGNGNDSIDGGAGDNHLIGGAGDDVLSAGDGNNNLEGGNGNDRLTVGTGDNTLTGGNGNDTLVFGPGFGHNVVTDFHHGDVIEFHGAAFADFASVQAAMHQEGNSTVIGIDENHSITLQGVSSQSLHANDFLFT